MSNAGKIRTSLFSICMLVHFCQDLAFVAFIFVSIAFISEIYSNSVNVLLI